jgi:predicted transcriptional regulator
MTENQKAVLEKLTNEDMNVSELCSELHITPSSMRKILNNMVKSDYIKQEGSFYKIAMDYAPPVAWNFKPLMGAWK